MLKEYVMSWNRGIPVALLLLLCCAAAARTPQEREALPTQTWPKELDTASGRIVVYEPQLETFKGNQLTSRAAVSVTRPGSSAPVFGGFWMEATLSTDAGRRTARAVDVRVTEIRFPNTDPGEVTRLRREIAAEIPRWNLVYSVDALLAELKVLEERRALAQGLKADVPAIYFRSHPAVLLSIQGEPAWRALPGSSYRRLENTPLFVVQDGAGTCTLHVPPFWWTAKTPLGPWEAVEDVPEAVSEIWKNEPKPQLPPSDPDSEAPRRPEVIPVSGPAELIWTDGTPRYAPIAGTDLLYVTNTESDVFLHIPTQYSYVLLSGRWYRTPYSEVAWEFVPSDQLPSDFARIPLSSEKQHVLACVAGTPQAREAVLDAEIPRTEAVQTGPATDLVATYDGEPRFEDVEGSSVRYAVNTSYPIFCVQRRYYWCQGGIWYDSDYAVGPWFVCTWVPPAIYLIPPSCPYYYVTYCRIFSVRPRCVYVGYYPGYLGCYVWGRSVVYGTGWRYSCWTGNFWYPRPLTWGVGVRYNPYTCGWGVRFGSGYASIWGVRRPSSPCETTVQAGVGGYWGVAPRRVSVESSVVVSDRAVRTSTAETNLYTRQPEKRVSRPGRSDPPGRRESAPSPTRPPIERGAPPSPTDRREGPRALPPPSPREEREAPPRREVPRDPSPPSRERREEVPRTPPPPFRDEREAPRTPPPPTNREIPRDPAPPPRERREEPPRTPPPAPRERRDEAPRNPPPPPPRERREEAPRNPPPPPPPRERREEGPRNPPPPPPPPPPRNPPPPPPPRERRDEGPRNPPPPPPPRREERREERKDPPRTPDRRRSAPSPPQSARPGIPSVNR